MKHSYKISKSRICDLGSRIKHLATKTRRRKALSILLSALILLASVRVLLFIFPGDASASWWQGDGGTYLKRKQLTLTNDSSESLAADTTTAITVNTKALYDAGRIQDDCDDIRIVYQSGTGIKELTRHLVLEEGTTCATSQATKINFPLQATLANATSSTDYFMYYANRGAPTPTGTVDAYAVGDTQALLVCPFNGTTECINGAGIETPTTETGAIRYGGSKSALNFNENANFDNDIVEAGTDTSMDNIFDGEGTVEMWINLRSQGKGTVAGQMINKNNVWRMYTIQSGSNLRVYFFYNFDSTYGRWNTAYVVPINTWTHVAVVYNADSDQNSPVIYVNGTSESLTTVSDPSGTRVSDSGLMRLGANDTGGNAPLDGMIDEVRVSTIERYSGNFTPSTAPFVRDANTKLLYHFDETGDDPRNTGKAMDDSGNGNHGTITGAKYVEGLVGVNSSNEAGSTSGANSYAGHEGIFIEEGTTNKITNPSFDHTTFNTNWTTSISDTDTENTNAAYIKFGSKSVALDSAVESYNELNINAIYTLWRTTNYKRLAQGFQVSSNYIITGVKLLIDTDGTASNYYNVELQTDSTGVPSGTPITNGTSTCVAFSSIPSSSDFYKFTFATDPSLTASTQYHIVLKAFTDSGCSTEQSSADDTNHVNWRGDSSGTYTNGAYAEMNSSDVWTTETTRDFIFKLETGGTNNTDYYTAVDPDSTASHTLSAHVHRGTHDGVSQTIDNTVAQLIWEGSAQSTTTYTDMGGGWWRLSYSASTTDSSNNYGVQFLYGEYGYVDGVQLEEKAYTTTYADGSLVSDAGGADTYFWDDDCDGTLDAGEDEAGDENAQCSSRIPTDIDYSATSNISTSGTISFWYKRDYSDKQSTVRLFKWGAFHKDSIYMYLVNLENPDFRVEFKTDGGTKQACGVHSSPSIDEREWHLLTLTYTANSVGNDGCQIYVDTAIGSSGSSGQTWSFAPDDVTFEVGDGSNNFRAGGTISDLQIYDSALSAAEVADLYQSGLVSHAQGTETDFSDPKGADPLAVWHMDERADNTCDGTADVCDASGNGYHLASSGTAWEVGSGTGGSIGDVAQSFDGTDDYLSKASDTDFDFSASDDFSVSGWFRHSSTISGTDTIISKYESTDDATGWKVYMDSSGYVCFGIDNDGTFTPTDSACSTATQGSLADSRWHSFDVVKDGTDSITLYIDKQQVAQDASLAATGSLVNETTFYVGIDADGSSNPWDGDMDEIVIYPTARTADQVKSDLNNPQVSAVLGANITDPLMDGLIGYWKMDEQSGTTVTDYSGNGNTGTLTNAQETGTATNDANTTDTILRDDGGGSLSATDDVYIGMNLYVTDDVACGLSSDEIREITDYDGTAKDITVGNAFSADLDLCDYEIRHQNGGKYGSGVYFDGSNDVMTTGADGALDNFFDGGGTVALWLHPKAVSTNTYQGRIFNRSWINFMLYNESSGTSKLHFYQNFDGGGGNNAWALTNHDLTLNTWNHVVLTYNSDNAANNASIYVNGQLKDITQAHFATETGTRASSTGTIYFGDTAASNATLDGSMDEYRIYNRILSPSEAKDLYEWAPGPVGYWPMDEGEGTTSNDKSGNNDTQTLGGDGVGTDLPTWTRGKYGSALSFDGDDDFSNSTNDHSAIMDGSHFTYSVWVNPRSVDEAWPRITGTGGNWMPGFILNSTTGKPHFSFKLSDISDAVVTAPNALELNTWSYITGTYDGDDLRLYVNGTEVASNNYPNNYNVALRRNMGGLFRLGHSSVAFDGLMDEVRVYDYARTPAQIIEDMNAGHPLGGSPVGSPVARWKFDEMYGTTAQDTSDNDNDLTLSNASWTSSGKINSAWDGDGTEYLSRADDSDLDFAAADDMTITGWFTHPATNAADYIIYKETGDAGYAISMDADGDIVFGIGDTAASFPEESIGGSVGGDYDDGEWHHFAAIKNGTSSITLYVDGREIASDTSLAVAGSLENAAILYVGDSDGTNNGDEFLGDLDEIKFYRAALTPSQVLIDMNAGSATAHSVLGDSEASTLEDGAGNPPVGYWSMDENTGSTAYDKSGSGNDGTLISMTEASWIPGKYGSALDFNGTDDYVSVTDDDTYDFDYNEDFTISFWVIDSLDGDTELISKYGGSAYPFVIRRTGANNVNFTRYDGTHGPYTYTTSSISTTVWHHITAVKDGSNIRIYFDGVQEDSDPDTTTTTTTNSSNLEFGRRSGTSLYWEGGLDEIKIYDYARTPAQITYDYNRGRPVGWWRFDECTGTTAYDASGNGNNGTITPGTGTDPDNNAAGTCSSGNGNEMWNDGTTGKFNASLGFDGSDDYVTVTNDDVFNFSATEPFTVTVWAKLGSNSTGAVVSKDNAWEIRYLSNQDWFTFGEIGTSGADSKACSQSGFVSTGNWYFITAVHDGDGSGTVSCYTNSVLGGTRTGVDSAEDSSALYIGKRYNGGSPLIMFDGQIDDVRIYNYALSKKQIRNVMNYGAVRFE